MNKITIKKLETINELKELAMVFSRAFEQEYSTTDEYLYSIIKNSSCLVLGAMEQSRVVGGLIAFEMTPIHGIKEFYIYDIAVDPIYQKQGIGKMLMLSIKDEARLRGIGTIFVEAESEDTDAVAFYRKIGGEEVLVNHFNFYI
jgi:aminoglycoside 3-N-acetyltransferase I